MPKWRRSKYKSPIVMMNSEWETIETEEVIRVNNPNFNPKLTITERMAQQRNQPEVNQIDKTIEKVVKKSKTRLKTIKIP